MAGFFPVMMFGLPAACLAMYHAALPERRKAIGGMLFSLALTSMLTGVTEPIEFSFMFLAPVLYAVHAVLTGLSMALMNALGVKMGFGFYAGLLDYVLNFGRATRPLLLLPIGALLAIPVAGLSPPVVAGFLCFGLMALLFLVTEELLAEAHEKPDTPLISAMFFVGFLSLLLIEEIAM